MSASLAAALLFTTSVLQESVMPAPPRLPLPRPVANAPIAQVNDNRRPAGKTSGDTLVLALDIVDAAFQAEGPQDPVVRALAFAETGQAPMIPGPLIRAARGTTVRLTIRNRSDSSIMLGGLRAGTPPENDTTHVAAGATRQVTFRLDRVGNFFYWGALPGQDSFDDRFWLDSQLTGAIVVDESGSGPRLNERVWLITEWFLQPDRVRVFESVLVFNGKAWPHNERLTFQQNDSVHFRVINAAAIEHPLHLHGFYFRVTRHSRYGTDSIVPAARQVLQNMRMIDIGSSLSLSFVPTTPGNWVFHCHFATHINDQSSLRGAADAHPPGGSHNETPARDRDGGHTMRGLVIGMHVTPAPGYVEPNPANRRQIDLLIQKRPNALQGASQPMASSCRRHHGACAGFDPDTGSGARTQARPAGPHPGTKQPRRAERRTLARSRDRELSGWCGRFQRHQPEDHAAH